MRTGLSLMESNNNFSDALKVFENPTAVFVDHKLSPRSPCYMMQHVNLRQGELLTHPNTGTDEVPTDGKQN